MTLTPEHKEAMRVGREKANARRAKRKDSARAAYTKWLKEDSRLWRNAQNAGGRGPELQEWYDHLKTMPDTNFGESDD